MISFFFTYFFIPETRHRSLEDMDLIFGDVAAHENKERFAAIAENVGTEVDDQEFVKQVIQQVD